MRCMILYKNCASRNRGFHAWKASEMSWLLEESHPGCGIWLEPLSLSISLRCSMRFRRGRQDTCTSGFSRCHDCLFPPLHSRLASKIPCEIRGSCIGRQTDRRYREYFPFSKAPAYSDLFSPRAPAGLRLKEPISGTDGRSVKVCDNTKRR